tara:strand:+ start:539 stop:706 length:168 start_codon:yes stop_codon:yes gene_type:complete
MIDSRVVATTKLDERGLSDLRALLGVDVSDADLQRFVKSVQGRIESQRRFGCAVA